MLSVCKRTMKLNGKEIQTKIGGHFPTAQTMQIRGDLHRQTNIYCSDSFTQQGSAFNSAHMESSMDGGRKHRSCSEGGQGSSTHQGFFTHTINVSARVGRSEPAPVVRNIWSCLTQANHGCRHSSSLTWLNNIATRRFEEIKIVQSEAIIPW